MRVRRGVATFSNKERTTITNLNTFFQVIYSGTELIGRGERQGWVGGKGASRMGKKRGGGGSAFFIIP